MGDDLLHQQPDQPLRLRQHGGKPQLDADGGLTIRIQHDWPGKDKEANWLPAPDGPFFMVMRLYQPEEKMYRGEYIVPPVQKVQ